MGRDLVQKKAETQWGTGVVEQLSLDLKDAFPGVKGFSTTNIWYAKKWYLFYNEEFIKLHQPVGEIAMPKEFGAVKWSLEDINKPIGVASYQLQEIVDETLKMRLEE